MVFGLVYIITSMVHHFQLDGCKTIPNAPLLYPLHAQNSTLNPLNITLLQSLVIFIALISFTR
jgi:hypothetical protein